MLCHHRWGITSQTSFLIYSSFLLSLFSFLLPPPFLYITIPRSTTPSHNLLDSEVYTASLFSTNPGERKKERKDKKKRAKMNGYSSLRNVTIPLHKPKRSRFKLYGCIEAVWIFAVGLKFLDFSFALFPRNLSHPRALILHHHLYAEKHRFFEGNFFVLVALYVRSRWVRYGDEN